MGEQVLELESKKLFDRFRRWIQSLLDLGATLKNYGLPLYMPEVVILCLSLES